MNRPKIEFTAETLLTGTLKESKETKETNKDVDFKINLSNDVGFGSDKK